ncbi:MAG: nitroreductase family protein [Odoribacter sp.]
MKTSFLMPSALLLLLLATGGCSEKKEKKIETPEAIENIFARTSVRKYTAQAVEKDKVLLLLEAGMSAPSGKDTRPWELLVVNERALLDSLASALPYTKMLEEAPMAIIVCGDTTKSSYWFLDCSAVAQNILLAAEALDLGAVWTASFPYGERMDAVRRFITLPDHIQPLCVIPVGYPAVVTTPKKKWDPAKVHTNRW